MNPRRLLRKIQSGNFHNVSYSDAQRLVGSLGFQLERISGSHHIYAHPDLSEKLNIQMVLGQAKPYQLRQLKALIEEYDLTLEGDE